MAHVMNQVRVSPLSKKIENSLSTEFSHGQISAQVDFTVTENVNAGPNYQLKYFLGPGGANLFSYNRLLKDTLTLTFVPACKNLAAASTRADWMPEWVDTLENCGKVKTPLPERQAAPSRPTPAPDTRLQRQVTEQKFKAIVRGFSANNVLILQNVFRR